MKKQNEEPRKRFLALDTSTAILGVAITENGRLLHETNASGERNHSVHLLPIIEQALQATGTTSAMIGGVAVGLGPGSYTGTRIAVTAAKTLAWAWKVPVAGISTLQALAWGGLAAALKQQEEAPSAGEPAVQELAGTGPDWIIPLLDARRGQAYTALFTSDGEHAPRRLEPDAIRLMADWVLLLADRLKQAEAEGRKPRAIWFVGETLLLGSGESTGLLREAGNVHAVPYELEGRWAGYLGEERLQTGSDDLHSLIPNYTQLSEAEANLRRSSEGSLNQ